MIILEEGGVKAGKDLQTSVLAFCEIWRAVASMIRGGE